MPVVYMVMPGVWKIGSPDEKSSSENWTVYSEVEGLTDIYQSEDEANRALVKYLDEAAATRSS